MTKMLTDGWELDGAEADVQYAKMKLGVAYAEPKTLGNDSAPQSPKPANQQTISVDSKEL